MSREVTHRYRAAEAALAAVRFDEYGTPDRKLPDCPRCEENELVVEPYYLDAAICLRCNWRGTWQRQVDA